jgi:hypothetical protein
MKGFVTEKSTQVHSVSYDSIQMELTVEFKRGGRYKYFGVPEDIYIALANADSVGKALNALVKGKYEFQKL